MAQGLQDLQAANAALTAAINNFTTTNTQAISKLQSLASQLSSASTDPDADVEGIAQQLNSQVTALNNANAALAAAITAA